VLLATKSLLISCCPPTDRSPRASRCRRIVNSPVTFVGLELDGEATGVTSSVAGSALATDGRETDGDGALGALLEEGGDTEVLETVSALPDTVGAGSLGVDDTLGDALAVKVGEEARQSGRARETMRTQ